MLDLQFQMLHQVQLELLENFWQENVFKLMLKNIKKIQKIHLDHGLLKEDKKDPMDYVKLKNNVFVI